MDFLVYDDCCNTISNTLSKIIKLLGKSNMEELLNDDFIDDNIKLICIQLVDDVFKANKYLFGFISKMKIINDEQYNVLNLDRKTVDKIIERYFGNAIQCLFLYHFDGLVIHKCIGIYGTSFVELLESRLSDINFIKIIAEYAKRYGHWERENDPLISYFIVILCKILDENNYHITIDDIDIISNFACFSSYTKKCLDCYSQLIHITEKFLHNYSNLYNNPNLIQLISYFLNTILYFGYIKKDMVVDRKLMHYLVQDMIYKNKAPIVGLFLSFITYYYEYDNKLVLTDIIVNEFAHMCENDTYYNTTHDDYNWKMIFKMIVDNWEKIVPPNKYCCYQIIIKRYSYKIPEITSLVKKEIDLNPSDKDKLISMLKEMENINIGHMEDVD